MMAFCKALPSSARTASGWLTELQWATSGLWSWMGKRGNPTMASGGGPIFSPDSQRVAYGAQAGEKRFVVVDGKEGELYDEIVTDEGGGIIFDSADRLHYLAIKGEGIYLVEERIQ